MKQRRYKITAAVALGALALGGWFLYSVNAAQGQGALAQAPLNDQIQVEPAFIMAVDDSNSMTFERIFPGGDGRMQWNSENSSFFNNDGTFLSIGAGCQTGGNHPDCYLYLFPHNGYNDSYSPGRAIPPLDAFGFARSHVYNASYFNPAITYDPWMNADGSLWPAASRTAARADPRDSSYGSSFSDAYDVVYDLTSNRSNTGETFRLVNGMNIPNLAGTGVQYRRDNQWRTAARSIDSTTDYAFDYFPATYYLPAAEAAPEGYRSADANRPVIAGACGPGCDLRRYQIKEENYESIADYDAAIQNFANWFQYHRSRLLAMVGAMTHSMQDVNNMRVGYFTINSGARRVGNTAVYDSYSDVVMRDVSTERLELYGDLVRLQAGALALGFAGGTPNRSAVAHLGEQFTRSGANAPIVYSCQRNGGMLFTDGFTNSGNGPTDIGNIDGGLGAPFADGFEDTIADIAARYYLDIADGGLAPLRSGGSFSAGQVPVPSGCDADDPDIRLNCQRNLHMNFYGVTLGARGAIFDVNQAATEDPFTNFPNWNAAGNPRDSDGGPTIDEIWHATINTRGEFINARTPADITDAMRRVLSSVSAGASPSGTIALTGERVQSGSSSLYVVPSYEVKADGTDWSSTLAAFKVEVNENNEVVDTQVWEASNRLPSASSRANTVWFGRADGVERFSPTNANITWESLLSNSAMAIGTASEAQALGASLTQAIDYLLGDTSLEVRNPGGMLRTRTTRLGDIVNSTPVVSAPDDDYGYRSLPAPYGNSYQTFLDSKEDSRNVMVYVGANDGMLHAFDSGMQADGTMVDTTTNGREAFAYIPEAVMGHMGNLLFPQLEEGVNQKFRHRYYVDGPIAVSDVYAGGSWGTALVGTAGAGGRSVFSLDVTDPSSFGASDRHWEINDGSGNERVRDNIGHVLGRPLIVPVKTRAGSVSWKAVFGNGYASADNKAVLFLVDVDDPSNIHMIEAVESPATNPPGHMNNGLGNIIAVDRWGGANLDSGLRDGFVDTVYGADQRGALWKFDLRDISMNGVSVTQVQTPLFVTQTYSENGQTYRQPIIGGLTAVATSGGRPMIFFGSGSFSFVGDAADTSMQSLYGVLDRENGLTVPVSALQPRAITATIGGARSIATGPSALGNSGWYIDLPKGERFVGYPRILSGVVLMPTYAPDMTSGDGCSTSGLNWLFGLDARSGAPAMSDVSFGSPDGDTQADGVGAIALDTGGTAPVRNVEAMVESLHAGLPEPECDPSDPACVINPPPEPDEKCWMRAMVSGAPPMFRPYLCGRLSWRQIQ